MLKNVTSTACCDRPRKLLARGRWCFIFVSKRGSRISKRSSETKRAIIHRTHTHGFVGAEMGGRVLLYSFTPSTSLNGKQSKPHTNNFRTTARTGVVFIQRENKPTIIPLLRPTDLFVPSESKKQSQNLRSSPKVRRTCPPGAPRAARFSCPKSSSTACSRSKNAVSRVWWRSSSSRSHVPVLVRKRKWAPTTSAGARALTRQARDRFFSDSRAAQAWSLQRPRD